MRSRERALTLGSYRRGLSAVQPQDPVAALWRLFVRSGAPSPRLLGDWWRCTPNIPRTQWGYSDFGATRPPARPWDRSSALPRCIGLCACVRFPTQGARKRAERLLFCCRANARMSAPLEHDRQQRVETGPLRQTASAKRGRSTEAQKILDTGHSNAVGSHDPTFIIYSFDPRTPCKRSSSRSNSLNNSPP